ncbi:MAG TPA: APC family permease [Opitutaceae bacterium]|jgi:amino acid transporter|nr:APC family permease [Opitutaceae bacterium]
MDLKEREPAAHNPLHRNYLSGFESVSQTLGTMAPTGTLGVCIPLVIGKSGNATWLLFVAMLGICMLVLVNLNAFATRSASAGGPYTFARLGLGRRAGVAAGWIYFAAMLFGVASTAPSASYYACLVISRYTGIADTFGLGAAVTVLLVLAAAWTAYRDIKLSSKVMIVIEVTSLTVMVALVALAMAHDGPWIDRPQLRLEGSNVHSFSSGIVLSFLTMAGFESATTLGSEARNARRTIPRAIMACVLPLGAFYLVMTYLLVGLGRKYGIALDQLEAPFDTIARACNAAALGTASSVGIALSYFACTLGSINAGSRTLFALSEEGMFFRPFASAHPVNATPHRSIVLLAAFAVAAVVATSFSGITFVSYIDYGSQLTAFGFVATYFMVCLAAPFFLATLGVRHWKWAGASLAALVLLGIVMFQSLYPIPEAPVRYLPYVFGGTVAAGFALSYGLRLRRDPSAWATPTSGPPGR